MPSYIVRFTAFTDTYDPHDDTTMNEVYVMVTAAQSALSATVDCLPSIPHKFAMHLKENHLNINDETETVTGNVSHIESGIEYFITIVTCPVTEKKWYSF